MPPYFLYLLQQWWFEDNSDWTKSGQCNRASDGGDGG